MKGLPLEHARMAMLLIVTVAVPAQQKTAKSVSVFHQDVSWAPDSRRIAFSANRHSEWHVYLGDLETGAVQPLTHGPSADQWTTWSGDGQHIAYASASAGQPSDIYVIDIGAGAAPRRLTVQSGQRSSQPSWSADGHTIAFVSKRGDTHQQIWLMNTDGSKPRALTRLDVDAESPQWSPDGRRLVFYTDAGNHQDQIWTMNADGTGLTAGTHDGANNIYPSWTSSGDVVWSRQLGDSTTVMRAHADGSDAAPLVPQPAFFARVSPDGQFIALILGHYPATTLTICDIRGERCRVMDPMSSGT